MKPGAGMAITLRHGPAAPGQVMHDVSAAEIESFCLAHGAYVERLRRNVPDQGGRPEVTWTQMIVRLPDDGTGALPLLRHIILNDNKETTYKLALLRTLCRIADGAAGYARHATRDHEVECIVLPLGLVALYWLRLYKPLLKESLPQSADNLGLCKLGFVKEGYRAIESVSPLDLRIGMSGFDLQSSLALHVALSDAVHTIVGMPCRYITHSDGQLVFKATKRGRRTRPSSLCLDESYLSSFGEFFIPAALWMAFQRYAIWVEPAIVAEWVRLIQRFAEIQGRKVDIGSLSRAMMWPVSDRDVGTARQRALTLLKGNALRCVWSDKPLSSDTLAMDHCLPFSVWPCDDLWNLFPVHRRVNGQKSDRLPSSAMLRQRQEAILGWWERGYLAPDQAALRQRFEIEARGSLPSLAATTVTPDEIFSGLLLQQMRLRHDQQAPVWQSA